MFGCVARRMGAELQLNEYIHSHLPLQHCVNSFVLRPVTVNEVTYILSKMKNSTQSINKLSSII